MERRHDLHHLNDQAGNQGASALQSDPNSLLLLQLVGQPSSDVPIQPICPTQSVSQTVEGETVAETAGVPQNQNQVVTQQLELLEEVNNLLQQQQAAQQLALLQQQSLAGTVQALTHNLIPEHLRASAVAASLCGTPGHQPASIPPYLVPHPLLPSQPIIPTRIAASIIPEVALTVQDRPMTPPVYNGVNPNYPGLRVLNTSPPIFAVDNFLTPYECDFLINAAVDSFGPAPVVGKGAGEISPSRTSSTCYLAREDLPDLLRKVSLLTGKPIEHCELPQVGRYLYQQKYLQHFDAFDLATEDGLRFAANGGQRTITVLIYLNDVLRGGATRFPALNLDVQPRRGMALIFFPATVDGMLDKMALHAALPAIDTKFVSQVWIRQSSYAGQPSKRLQQPLGLPFAANSTAPQQNIAPNSTVNLFAQQAATATLPMQY